jgi:hypothetical protein
VPNNSPNVNAGTTPLNGTAANAGTAGQLPTTLGAITGQNIGTFPLIKLIGG